MNKYYRNMIAIILIVITLFLLFTYWLKLNFGFEQITLVIAGMYAIYLNLRAKTKRENEI